MSVQQSLNRFPWLLGLLFWVSLTHGQELVAHADVPVAALTRNEARLYLTMRVRNWPDGRAVQVFVLPDNHPLHVQFVTDVLELYPYQLRRVWDRQLFSGTGQAPITVIDPADLLRRVATTPGAIGYAEDGASLPPEVHPLEVQ